jgi:hypothetical protein
MGGRSMRVRSGVRVMRCTSCGAELILTNVVPDETVAVRGVEHHTFVCPVFARRAMSQSVE